MHITAVFALWLSILLIPQTNCNNIKFRLHEFINCMEQKGYPIDSIITRDNNLTHYDQLNHQWNLRIPQIYPLAYFLLNCTKDVQNAVKCGRESTIRVVPKGGGHSYESYSFGSSDTVIIDFRRMDSIEIELNSKTGIAQATIESGALVGQINMKLWNSGEFGIPTGNCHSVGIAGLTLGGGHSYFSHSHGLTIDSVVEMKMVDANGSTHLVNASQNQDLFWALRGVGPGSIGIVTSFKFKLFNASQIQIRRIFLTYNLLDDLENSVEVLESFQCWLEWTKINTPHVHSEIFFSGTEAEVSITDVHNKDRKNIKRNEDELEKIILEMFPKPKHMTVRTFNSYMDFMLEIGAVKTQDEELDRNDLRTIKPYYVRQKTFFGNNLLQKDVLENMAKILQRIPNRYVWAVIASKGGAFGSVPRNATAYVHRDSLYSAIARYEGPNNATDVTDGWAWIKDFVDATKLMDNGGTYQNFVDEDLKDYLQRYYGTDFPRLIQTKKDWDPTNYFQNPQSLPVSG